MRSLSTLTACVGWSESCSELCKSESSGHELELWPSSWVGAYQQRRVFSALELHRGRAVGKQVVLLDAFGRITVEGRVAGIALVRLLTCTSFRTLRKSVKPESRRSRASNGRSSPRLGRRRSASLDRGSALT